MRWTDEHVKKLVSMLKKGSSASKIAEALGDGATRNAVIGKIHRLGLSNRDEKADEPDSEASSGKKARAARSAHRGNGNADGAGHGATKSRKTGAPGKEGATKADAGGKPRLSREQELISSMWMEGKSASQIAKVLEGGATRSSVMGKLNRLGLLKRSGKAAERRGGKNAGAGRSTPPKNSTAAKSDARGGGDAGGRTAAARDGKPISLGKEGASAAKTAADAKGGASGGMEVSATVSENSDEIGETASGAATSREERAASTDAVGSGRDGGDAATRDPAPEEAQAASNGIPEGEAETIPGAGDSESEDSSPKEADRFGTDGGGDAEIHPPAPEKAQAARNEIPEGEAETIPGAGASEAEDASPKEADRFGTDGVGDAEIHPPGPEEAQAARNGIPEGEAETIPGAGDSEAEDASPKDADRFGADGVGDAEIHPPGPEEIQAAENGNREEESVAPAKASEDAGAAPMDSGGAGREGGDASPGPSAPGREEVSSLDGGHGEEMDTGALTGISKEENSPTINVREFHRDDDAEQAAHAPGREQAMVAGESCAAAPDARAPNREDIPVAGRGDSEGERPASSDDGLSGGETAEASGGMEHQATGANVPETGVETALEIGIADSANTETPVGEDAPSQDNVAASMESGAEAERGTPDASASVATGNQSTGGEEAPAKGGGASDSGNDAETAGGESDAAASRNAGGEKSPAPKAGTSGGKKTAAEKVDSPDAGNTAATEAKKPGRRKAPAKKTKDSGGKEAAKPKAAKPKRKKTTANEEKAAGGTKAAVPAGGKTTEQPAREEARIVPFRRVNPYRKNIVPAGQPLPPQPSANEVSAEALARVSEVEKVSLRIGLMDLTERTCKWPVGDPATPDFWFCGLPTQQGKPYCEAHAGVAFQVPAPRRDRRR